MNYDHNPDITRLLLEFDPQLTVAPQQQERLLELVYAELRATARGLMSANASNIRCNPRRWCTKPG